MALETPSEKTLSNISKDMANLEQIEAAILSLSSPELEKLKRWFFDLDYEHWDKQLEQDIAEGKLEALAREAIAEFATGDCLEI